MPTFIVAAVLSIASPAPPAGTRGHLCWIDRVLADGTGARVFFTERVPGRHEAGGEHVEVGDALTPSNSSHDGCRITAERRKDRIGVSAEAYSFIPGLMAKPHEATEWIEAEAGR